jgi:hypothetical protein
MTNTHDDTAHTQEIDPIAQMRSACAIFTGDIRTQLEERIQAICDAAAGKRDNFDLDGFRI